MKTFELEVENIKCGGCAHSIRTALEELVKAKNVLIDIEREVIKFDADENVEVDVVIKKLDTMGYPLKGANNLVKTVKSYVSCMVGKVNS